MSFRQVMEAWTNDLGFRRFWRTSLRELSFDAYCWECPAVHKPALERVFECVFISSPSLARSAPDPSDFAEHFRPGCAVSTFWNLGGDALLVAPCPDEAGGNFAHLASFTETARPARQDALWKAVGNALHSRISAEPVWLSTAGHDVPWLHVRLDTRPKYYRHAGYLSA